MGLPPPSKERIQELIAAWQACGSKRSAARSLGIPEATFHNQLDIGMRLYGLAGPNELLGEAKGRRTISITDGVVFVGGDAHYWPGEPSTAHKAFVKFLKRERNLSAVVMNGDAYDLPNMSRFDADWFKTPTTKDELETVDDRLGDIVKAGGKAKRYFVRGNHDVRYDRYLAKNAPEVRGIPGTTIDDRLPLWEVGWSLFVNDGPGGVVIKHRPPKGGIHSTTNSPLWSGRTTVCNHLHALQVRPHTDYNGTRWGVDAGCLADIYGPQFSYLEDAVRSWRAGFARLKWVAGRLLTPELIRVVEPNVVEFRGELIEV